MKLKNDFNFFVIVGIWNKNIFNEKWIKKYLLPKDEFEIEYSAFGISHRVSTKGFKIEFFHDKITFSITDISKIERIYEKTISIATQIADYLPHTPVKAFGINFLFESDIKSEEVKYEFMKKQNMTKLEKLGYKDINLLHKFNLKSDDINNLNITISTDKTNQKLLFDFNFHFKISDLTELKSELYTQSSFKKGLYAKAIDILKKVYGIKKIK